MATLALGRGGAQPLAGRMDVRAFAAKGDGKTLDTEAIQRAIDAAAKAGGGTVVFPAGNYLCFSLRLHTRIALEFESGATLIAATPDFSVAGMQYDLPEPQPDAIAPFQDYGHNHWHNSLLWGEDLDQIAIVGKGVLFGRGLQKGDGPDEERPGAGNKMIALKNCRNVLIRDVMICEAGHFGILASGVDNLTIEEVQIDTRRDGIDIDSCRYVHISNCTVNAPWDDAIVLKSSYSLGELRPTEAVSIVGCTVTGSFYPGSLIDATYRPVASNFPNDPPALVGRIKIGTETNGDVRNIVVSDCIFEGCRGLAVESEDGGHIEDVRFSNITMRNLTGPPFFVRLGSRLRGPAGTAIGSIERISFESIDGWNASSEYCSVLSGVPGHPIRDVSFSNIQIAHHGGGKRRKGEVPEEVAAYPDPQMFGPTPAQGFYMRHVENCRMDDVQIRAIAADERPLLVLDDVRRARLQRIGSDRTSIIEGRNLSDVVITDDRGTAQTIVPYHP